jgi:dimethylglycine dehydrogenase
VTAIRERSDGGWRLEMTQGAIEAEYVITPRGTGAEVAAAIGEYLPIVSLSHQYLVTEDIPQLAARGAARLPLLRDPDVSYYLRQERHGLLLGPYEAQARAHWLEGLPEEFAHQLFPDDLARIERYVEAACGRVPILGSVGLKRVINGPIPYAPDGNPLMDPAAGRRNFLHCCAFTFGIAQAGGAGRAIADWVVNGEPDGDVWPVDCRRYWFCGPDLRSRQGARDLPERIRGRLPAGGAARGTPHESLASVRAVAGRGGGVRGAGRLGTCGVLREKQRPAGPRVLVPQAPLAPRHRARVRGRGNRCCRAGSARLHEVRGGRQGRGCVARRMVAVRCRPRDAWLSATAARPAGGSSAN